MRKAKTAKEILIASRWLLVNHGWCRFYQHAIVKAMGHDKHSFCALGALLIVEKKFSYYEAYDKLVDALPSDYNFLLSDRGAHLAEWNDDYRRTKEQVIKLFDRAIKSCDE